MIFTSSNLLVIAIYVVCTLFRYSAYGKYCKKSKFLIIIISIILIVITNRITSLLHDTLVSTNLASFSISMTYGKMGEIRSFIFALNSYCY